MSAPQSPHDQIAFVAEALMCTVTLTGAPPLITEDRDIERDGGSLGLVQSQWGEHRGAARWSPGASWESQVNALVDRQQYHHPCMLVALPRALACLREAERVILQLTVAEGWYDADVARELQRREVKCSARTVRRLRESGLRALASLLWTTTGGFTIPPIAEEQSA
jgi:hypothetical protein